MLSHRLIAALASATLAVASPALADPREAPPVPTAAASPAVNTTMRAQTVSPNQRYCMIDTPTGSHIRKRVCDTRSGWLVYGFDPLTAPLAAK